MDEYYVLLQSDQDGIYSSWNACLEFVNKKKLPIIKKFDNKSDALKYFSDHKLNNLEQKGKTEKQKKKKLSSNTLTINGQPIEYPYSFSAGLFSGKNYFYGGLIHTKSNLSPIVISGHGMNKEISPGNGSCIAEMAAISNIIYRAKKMGLTRITIYYLDSHLNPNTIMSKKHISKSELNYLEFIRKYKKVMRINFVQILSRKRDDGHQLVSKLARDQLNKSKEEARIKDAVKEEEKQYENIK